MNVQSFFTDLLDKLSKSSKEKADEILSKPMPKALSTLPSGEYKPTTLGQWLFASESGKNFPTGQELVGKGLNAMEAIGPAIPNAPMKLQWNPKNVLTAAGLGGIVEGGREYAAGEQLDPMRIAKTATFAAPWGLLVPTGKKPPKLEVDTDLDPAWIKEGMLDPERGLGRDLARKGFLSDEITRMTPGGSQKMLVENIPGQSESIMARAEKWKDKPRLSYARETMERNFDDIMGKDAPSMKERYIQPIYKSEAERINWLNKEREDIKALGIAPRSTESKLVQQLGEGLVKREEVALLPNAEKIFTAEKVLRTKYDTYLSKLNMVLKRNGYEAVPKRDDYFRHFTEIKGLLEEIGIPMRENQLPTDINGLTADFRPGRQFFASTLQRKTDITDYDAIQGIDGYIEGASKQMFHTDNIKRLRGLDKTIRNTFAGTRHLTNFVADVTEYTNILAGKKAMIDRSIETGLGRGIYSASNALKKRVGGNMVGANVASSLTNYIPLTQSLATTDKPSFINGMLKTIVSTFKDDGFVSHSDFLTSRLGSDRLAITKWDKVTDKSMWLFKVIDKFVSETIVRGKFEEGIKKGMTATDAMKQADSWGRKILAGRTAGEMPTLFSSKTLGLLTQFQLEVNNQISFMGKDIPRMYDAKGAASALGQVFLYSYVFNNLYEKAFGRRPAFDPIGVGVKAYEDYNNPDMDKGTATKRLAENTANQLPFVSTVTGGRIPLSSALPDVSGLIKGTTDLKREGIKAATYILPPTAGGQIKKTIEGVNAYRQGASKTPSGNERFPIPQTMENAIRTALGGQYATPEGQAYVDQLGTPSPVADYTKMAGERTQGEQATAEKIFKDISGLTDDKKMEKLRALKKEGTLTKAVYDRVISLKKEDVQQATKKEKAVYNLPVHEEALWHIKLLDTMNDQKQREYLSGLKKRGLLSEETYNEIVKIKGGK